MITPTQLNACATTNQLLTQLMCQHIVDDQGGVCGQVTFVKQFYEAHADIYEEPGGKMFQLSMVKMAVIKDNREVIAVDELLAGEVLGLYPSFRNVKVGDIMDSSVYGNLEDSDIPRLIRIGRSEDCNCVLELKDNDCIIRAARTICTNEVLVRTPWVMNSIDRYLTTNDDEFQSWTRNVPWIHRASTKEERYAICIEDDIDEQFPVLTAGGLQTHQVQTISVVLKELLHLIKDQILQYHAYKDEDSKLRILLKTNIDNLMEVFYKEYYSLIKESRPKATKKRSHDQVEALEYHIHVNEEWLAEHSHEQYFLDKDFGSTSLKIVNNWDSN